MENNQQQVQGPSVDAQLVVVQYQEELIVKTDELMKSKAYIRQLEYALVQLQKQLDAKEEPKSQPQQSNQGNNRKNRKNR
ncbi:hypothetical protein CIB87_28150 [Priestia megaterium]|uniref:Uncharacterized protein n=1 Tax=Priestia megaterium TaxID=1404 RepID=A0AA86IPF3_PRIMG|nr:hypothetical protein [Priestia megaterium]AXI32663.1 hypothetical protein CIB87_28150 [Priestia megaterium]